MNALLAVVCGALGVVAGLALNVVIDRVPAKEPFRPARFRCPKCPEGTPDSPGWPFVAWLSPSGKCPACGQPLPTRYLLVPFANAALWAAAAVRFGADWALPAYLLFFSCLLSVSVIDLRSQIIPNRIIYPTIFASLPLLALAALAGGDWDHLKTAVVGAAAAWLVLLVVHLVQPGGMGFGDVRLSFVIGLFLGWIGYRYVLIGLFLGFVLGAVIGVLLVALRLRKRTDHVPFGPFLATGAAVIVLAGGPIVRYFLKS